MHADLRKQYNAAFTAEAYEAMLSDIAQAHNHRPIFRIAESPIFISKALKAQLLEACELISAVIAQPNFKELSQGALLPDQIVPNEDEHTIFLQMDFGICADAEGNLSPQLIEVQGFPSLYFFQDLLAKNYRKHFSIPDNYSHLFDGLTSDEYIAILKKVIIGETSPEKVVLLEVEPDKQTTQIDFWAARDMLGVHTCCVTDLHKEGRFLYYIDKNGEKVKIEKIVNRVIFDELLTRNDLKRNFSFSDDLEVEWIGHPNWFFRISKYTLPFLKNKYVPETQFLSELKEIPEDLHNYVLKPLYSFAGTGVLININRYDLEGIKNPKNYILQRKVNYAPIVETPSGPAKCEVRMLMLWEKGAAMPRIINNLARLSKGEMVGVRYNKDKDWVGGSVGFFEE